MGKRKKVSWEYYAIMFMIGGIIATGLVTIIINFFALLYGVPPIYYLSLFGNLIIFVFGGIFGIIKGLE